MKIIRFPTRKSTLFLMLALALNACAASPGSLPAAASADQGVVLLRTYFVALRPDLEMGASHPPLTGFVFTGPLPGGQDGKAQLDLLSRRLTLPTLGFQFSDTTAVSLGKDATLAMGFGEIIQVGISGLSRAGDGGMTAGFSFRFGAKEPFRRTLPFKPGEALLFAGHLDASLPILSAVTLEIRMFPPEKRVEMEEFAAVARKDRQAFAPPVPTQRSEEPYLPGVGDVTLPELVAHENARYPDAARPEKMNGQVIVEVTVDREGKATAPRILITSSPYFDFPALEAAKTYRYRPATKNGQPVAVTMNLIMIFQYTARPGS